MSWQWRSVSVTWSWCDPIEIADAKLQDLNSRPSGYKPSQCENFSVKTNAPFAARQLCAAQLPAATTDI
jgi:hypothetical protein